MLGKPGFGDSVRWGTGVRQSQVQEERSELRGGSERRRALAPKAGGHKDTKGADTVIRVHWGIERFCRVHWGVRRV